MTDGITAYNQRRGSALAVQVMDIARSASEAKPISLWDINKAIADKYELKGNDRKNQYYATRVVVQYLESAAMLASRKEWQESRYTKMIWPCWE